MASDTQDLVVYTCIAGGYDDLQPVQREPGVTYVCFTDQAPRDNLGWDIRPLPMSERGAVMANRYVKMHPHLLFPHHARSLYVDGTIAPKLGVAQLARQALSAHGFAMFAHPFRDCAYDEATECALVGHDWTWAFARQMRRYRDEGLPAHWGLFECNVLFRQHHAPEIVALMEAWWREFTTGVRRDQLSLPYLLWKSGVVAHSLGASHIRAGNPQFGFRLLHNTVPRKRQLRHYVNLALLAIAPLPKAERA